MKTTYPINSHKITKKLKILFSPKLKLAEVFFILKKVLVFFGGCSPERDISVITGVLTARSLDSKEYQAIPIFITENMEFFTGESLLDIQFYKNPDTRCLNRCILVSGSNLLFGYKRGKLKEICEVYCAINCMHGQMGEDGTLSGVLRYSKIPEVAPDIFCQSLAIDKEFTKIFSSEIGVPTVEGMGIKREDFFSDSNAVIAEVERQIGYPTIVKPARLGSSIGIESAKNSDQLFIAIVRALRYDDKVICEKYLTNSRDINCAVYSLGGKITISRLEEPLRRSEILSFQDKYGGGKLENSAKRTPDDLSSEVQAQIKGYAGKLYERLGFSGIVRFDFLIDESGVYLNEINAVPGSLAYYLFCDKLSEFSMLLSALIEDSVKASVKRSSLYSKFESNVLKGDWSGIKK